MPTGIQTAYSVATYIEAVRRRLAQSQVDTEIEDTDFEGSGYDAGASNPVLGIDGLIAQVLIWYSRYSPDYRWSRLDLNGNGVYTIPAANVGFGIQEVLFPQENTILSLGGFSDPYLIWSGTYLRDIADVELALQYYGTAEKLFGSNRVWEFHFESTTSPPQGKLFISPNQQSTLDHVIYRWAKPWELENVSFTDLDLILKYGVGMAKEQIGEARRKFGGIPGENESQEMDGSDLVTEGREDMENTADLLRRRKGDLVPPEIY